MKITITGVVASTLFLLGAPLLAQDDETPQMFTYASYFSCSGPLARADEIMAADAERMDGLVADGTISSWGWLAHYTGGQWQRISYHQAETLGALLDGSDAIQQGGGNVDEGADAAEDDGPPFGAVCGTHEDYIWTRVAGTSGQERGEAGFSVYHTCDIAREDRADEIVKDHFGPIYDKLVEEGKLTSWGWQSHVVGGKYRRLQTMTAANHKSLLAARGEALQTVYGDDGDDAAGAEFVDICGPHVDYMWNIVHETS